MKILLAEDTMDMNHAVTVLLEHSGFTVDSAFDGAQALDLALENGYDGMVLDIMMPKMDGIQVLKELRSRNIQTPVLLLTAKAEVDDRVAGLDAGADDYLPKPFAMKELLARVRAMTRRRAEYSSDTMTFGDLSLDASTFELKAENAVRLSVREFELMQMLMRSPGQALDAGQLLSRVWEGEPEADEAALWLYISYLKRKLAAVASSVQIEGSPREGRYRLSLA